MTFSDSYCRMLAMSHYENFSVVSPFVPSTIRRDLQRIYAFARTTDDFGDEKDLPSASGSEARIERLVAWRNDVAQLFSGVLPRHPVLVALSRTITRQQLAPQPFFDLVDANVQDQRVTSYADWGALREYCMLSAAPVGRMVLGVFGVHSPRATSLSDDVCIGLQLANFAQDVSVDTAKGRSYLLQSDLRQGTEHAVAAHCSRARTLLASGEELERSVPRALQRQLMLYRLGGLAIVDAIARGGYHTQKRRPQVSFAIKCELMTRVLFAAPRRIAGRGHAEAT